jgi:hypothetical protein
MEENIHQFTRSEVRHNCSHYNVHLHIVNKEWTLKADKLYEGEGIKDQSMGRQG